MHVGEVGVEGHTQGEGEREALLRCPMHYVNTELSKVRAALSIYDL